jgi:predicted RNase H-like HicB family nuclease
MGLINDLESPREEKVMIGESPFTAVLVPDLEDGGYSVYCKEIPSANSQGETIQEALDNLADAIELCLETEAELKVGKKQTR